MPRLSFDASSTKITGAMPIGTIAVCVLAAIETAVSKIKDDGGGGNPMAICSWQVAEGPYQGRTVGYDYVVMGGHTAKGDPMPLVQFFRLIDALKVPWAADNTKPLVARPFVWKRLANGDSVCLDPDTEQPLVNADVNFPDDFLGKSCRIRFGVRKNGDREFNQVEEKIAL